MPARWPISANEVSQLPRWPIASLSWSSARAAGTAIVAHSAAASAPSLVSNFIHSSHEFGVVRSYCGLAYGGLGHSGDALLIVPQRELLGGDAEGAPVGRLRHDPFERADLGMGNMRRGASDRHAGFAHPARRVDHQAAEFHDRDVARAQPLLGAVDNAVAPHGFPHRDVLVGDARDAGEVAELHRLAVLQVGVLARALVAVVLVDVDPDLGDVELAPSFLVDAFLIGSVPGDEIEVRVAVVDWRQHGGDVV